MFALLIQSSPLARRPRSTSCCWTACIRRTRDTNWWRNCWCRRFGPNSPEQNCDCQEQRTGLPLRRPDLLNATPDMSDLSDPFREARQGDGVLKCPFHKEEIVMILRHEDVR